MFTPDRVARRQLMMLFLCLSAGMLYWGVLVFRVTTDTSWGQYYWAFAAFLSLLATTFGCRELLRSLQCIVLRRDTAIEVLESVEHQTQVELRRRRQELDM